MTDIRRVEVIWLTPEFLRDVNPALVEVDDPIGVGSIIKFNHRDGSALYRLRIFVDKQRYWVADRIDD